MYASDASIHAKLGSKQHQEKEEKRRFLQALLVILMKKVMTVQGFLKLEFGIRLELPNLRGNLMHHGMIIFKPVL